MKPKDAFCGGLADPQEAADRILRSGWKARPDAAVWPLQRPIDWTTDPFVDRNWRFQLNAWRPLDVLITAHHLLGSDPIFENLVGLMLDWADFDDHNTLDEVLWNDMGAGLRAAKLGYVLSQPAIADAKYSDARDRLTRLAKKHLARLRDPSFIGLSNHALFQVHGALALCRLLETEPEAIGGVEEVEQTFSRLLKTQFGDQGVHLEHSPGYHVFAFKAVKRMAATGWYQDMPKVQAALRMAQRRTPWFTFPDGSLSEFGDSSPGFARKIPLVSSAGVTGRLFDEAGYAIVRTGENTPPDKASMLAITGSHHSNVHKHADCLSFELFEHGRRVVVDTGKYSYSNKTWRTFTDSAAAHNAIDLLEERTDNGLRATPPVGNMLTNLSETPWGWAVSGGFARPAFGVSHDRMFLYRPGDWLILLDEVTASRERAVTAWLHLDPALHATQADSGWDAGEFSVRYVGSRPATLDRKRGEVEPEIQGWKATSYHTKRPNDALGATLVGDRVHLATIISVGSSDVPAVEWTDRGFCVRFNGEDLLGTEQRVHWTSGVALI